MKIVFLAPAPFPCHHLSLYPLTLLPHVTAKKMANLSSESDIIRYILACFIVCILHAPRHKFKHKQMAEEMNKRNVPMYQIYQCTKTKQDCHVHAFYFHKQVCFRSQAQICLSGFFMTGSKYLYNAKILQYQILLYCLLIVLFYIYKWNLPVWCEVFLMNQTWSLLCGKGG